MLACGVMAAADPIRPAPPATAPAADAVQPDPGGGGAAAGLTHLDEQGRAHMVQVGNKIETARTARASGRLLMQRGTLDRILQGDVPKGDVLQVARIAAIQATKRTAELIPLCHPLRLTGVKVELVAEPTPERTTADEPAALHIRVEVRAFDRTGVEMEALTAVSIAGLTVYDMCKAIDKGMRLTDVQLDEKLGGKSGAWQRE